MLKEIKAGAVLEFDPSEPMMFMLVWYDEHGQVEFARRVSYAEMQDMLDEVYPDKEIDAYIDQSLREMFQEIEDAEADISASA